MTAVTVITVLNNKLIILAAIFLLCCSDLGAKDISILQLGWLLAQTQ